MQNMPSILVVFATLLATATSNSVLIAKDHAPTLDETIETAMEQWNVPGLAIAVIRRGKVDLVRGYGVTAVGGQTPVTTDTLFPLASCTKPFTATVLGMLVDDGKLTWDDRVKTHLPQFELQAPFVTREVTVKDLLAHRTGLSSANLLWSKNEFSPGEIMNRLKFVPFSNSFRSQFTYNNLMYLVAGQIVEAITEQTWGSQISERILQPLRMTSTFTSCPSEGVIAQPHYESNGKAILLELERNYSDSIAPAGSIWSTAEDIAKWIRWNLASNRDNAVPVLSANTLSELHSAHIVRSVYRTKTVYPKQIFAAHGLGWWLEDYRGHRLVRHGGVRNGYLTWIAFLPEEDFGFAILSNSHQTGINFALHHWLLDDFLQQPQEDWSTIVRDDYANGWRRALRESRENYERERKTGTSPSVEREEFTGTFRHDLYGDLTICRREGGLELRFGPRRITTLRHWQDNVFEADFTNPMIQDWHLTFRANKDGSVVSVRIVAAPWAPAWFDEKADLGEFVRVSDSEDAATSHRGNAVDRSRCRWSLV